LALEVRPSQPGIPMSRFQLPTIVAKLDKDGTEIQLLNQ
jgi:hypothetical protein